MSLQQTRPEPHSVVSQNISAAFARLSIALRLCSIGLEEAIASSSSKSSPTYAPRVSGPSRIAAKR